MSESKETSYERRRGVGKERTGAQLATTASMRPGRESQSWFNRGSIEVLDWDRARRAERGSPLSTPRDPVDEGSISVRWRGIMKLEASGSRRQVKNLEMEIMIWIRVWRGKGPRIES